MNDRYKRTDFVCEEDNNAITICDSRRRANFRGSGAIGGEL
jgi:hypothetical protein